MARMIPSRIPKEYLDNPGREAEREMYEAFEDELDGRHEVYCWVPIKNVRPGSRPAEAEVDFLIAHPDRGVLAVEVKGGVISRKGDSNEWFSRDRSGHLHSIRDPFRQADRARFAVRRRLEEAEAAARVMTDGYAVAFPDVRAPDFDLGSGAGRELLLCSEDYARLPARIDGLFEHWARVQGGPAPPGAEGMNALRRQFARSFELQPSLVAEFRRQRRRIERLSEGQFALLLRVARERRVLVTGGAGTGKTLLALERARQLAVAGLRTLLCCFNRPLAAHLRALGAGIPGLEVATVHELYHALAVRAGDDLPSIADAERLADPADYFMRELPDRFVAALDRFPEARYDAIVVDEGQDFCGTDQAALELALADPGGLSFLCVFQDSAQAVYPERGGWRDEGFARLDLTENLRNTSGVHECLGALSPAHAPRGRGPDGPAPELVEVLDDGTMLAAVTSALHRFVHEQDVPAEQIAILTTSRDEFPLLERDGRIGVFPVTHDEAGEPGHVLLECVTRFKGLEREIVILTALRPKPYLDGDALLYVGASRASQRLVVIERPELLARFRPGNQSSGSTA